MRCINLNKVLSVRVQITGKILFLEEGHSQDENEILILRATLWELSHDGGLSWANQLALQYPQLPNYYIPLPENNPGIINLLGDIGNEYRINLIEEYSVPTSIFSNVASFFAPLAATLMGCFIHNARVHPDNGDLGGCS